MERPTCKTCPYWFVRDRGVYGECRRRSPVAGTGKIALAQYPSAFPAHWCGEHPAFPAYLRSLEPAPAGGEGE